MRLEPLLFWGLIIACLVLLIIPLPSRAEPFHVRCVDRDYCINRPGLLMDGFPINDGEHPNYNAVGGTIPVGDGVKASPIYVLSGNGEVVIFRSEARPYRAYVAPAAAVFVVCPKRLAWAARGGERFRCP